LPHPGSLRARHEGHHHLHMSHPASEGGSCCAVPGYSRATSGDRPG
jgi:hypothetical protein